MTTNIQLDDTPIWDILYTSSEDLKCDKSITTYSIKSFNESLKKTFSHLWLAENKSEWMQIVSIFKILDTFHFFNLLEIYNENILSRHDKINNYLKQIKGYNEKNCSFFIVAFQHYLK